MQGVDEVSIAIHHDWSLASVQSLVRVEKASTVFSNSFIQVQRKVQGSIKEFLSAEKTLYEKN